MRLKNTHNQMKMFLTKTEKIQIHETTGESGQIIDLPKSSMSGLKQVMFYFKKLMELILFI